VVVANLGSRSSDQSGESSDEFSRFIQVALVAILAEPALHGSGAHKVNGGGGDDLNGWHLCNVTHLFGY
jgi:hypothetical protein